MIDREAKAFFDDFEGLSDDFYSLTTLKVKDHKTGALHNCLCYVINNFRQDLLNENTIFLDNYSSKNSHFPEYRKIDDTPENFKNLVEEIKEKP